MFNAWRTGQEGKALRWFLKRLEDTAPFRAALGIRDG
jgi:hypothetical protein